VSAPAWIFPGQGLQFVGMGASLVAASPVAREVFEAADAALDLPLAQICREGPEAALRQTELAQPAILTHSVAAVRAYEAAHGAVGTGFAVGHSLGEWTALVVAGSLAFDDAVRLVHLRGRLMQQAVADGVGAMVAVLGVVPEAVEAACAEVAADEVLAVATYNGPRNVVVSGHAAAVARLDAHLRRTEGARVVALPVSAPFHCALMQPAAAALAEALARTTLHSPSLTLVSTVTAAPVCEPTEIAARLVEQLVAPVRFEQAVQALSTAGVTEAYAPGPAASMRGMVRRIAGGPKVKVLAEAVDCGL
jgi:[acyl-carrier-protein] S-malonyltransferase